MAINNPYVPGDPFSYDLKWLVRKIKDHQIILDGLDERIQNAIIAALEDLDQLGPKYFESAADLISSDLKDKSIAYIEGFFAPGDGGANLYYVTTDYNDIIGVDFYLTLDGPNRWALPIIVTPYVTPEMFGAYGDGAEDDSAALKHAFKYDNIVMNKSYLLQDLIDLKNGQKIVCNGTVYVDYDYAGLSSTTIVFHGNGIKDFSWKGGTIKGTGADTPNYLNLFIFDNSENILFEDVKIIDMPMVWNILCKGSKYMTCRNVYVNHYSYGAIGYVEGSENGTVEGCTIKNLDVAGVGTGYPIMLSGGSSLPLPVSKNMIARGNIIDNSDTIARWEGIDAHGGENITITGNIIKGCITGIAAFSKEEGGVMIYELKNAVISGNTIVGRSDGNAGTGITIAGKFIEVCDNVIKDFTQTYRSCGIGVSYGVNMHVHDNAIYNCKVGLTLSRNDGLTVLENNLVAGCGNYTDHADSPAILLTGLQTCTYIANNKLEACDGTYRGLGNSYQHTYYQYKNNKVTNPVNDTYANFNNVISDIAVQQPSNSTTPMGYLGDIVQLRTPPASGTYSWICTSAWDGTSATWTAYISI